MTHPPGCGISSDPKRARSAGKRRILARIFFTRSLLSFDLSKCVVSISRVFPSNFTSPHSDLMMSTKVKISPIRGTFSRWDVVWNRQAAINGSAAFFDPDIVTFPESHCGQVRRSIGWYFIESLSFCKCLETLYPISYTSDGLYFNCSIQFFSDIFYMGIDGSIIQVVIITDNILHECITFYDTFRIFDEIF